MAVALMTDGMAAPNTCGFWGSFSEWAVLTCVSSESGESCATAPLAAATANAAAAIHTRAEFRRKAAATIRISLKPQADVVDCRLFRPAERSLSDRVLSTPNEGQRCFPCEKRRSAHSRGATSGQAPGNHLHIRCRAGGEPARTRRPATADLRSCR